MTVIWHNLEYTKRNIFSNVMLQKSDLVCPDQKTHISYLLTLNDYKMVDELQNHITVQT